MSDMVNKLLELDLPEPETMKVHLPRLGLTVTLREVGFDRVMKDRAEAKDATLFYLLDAIQAPDFRDDAWFRVKMGCPTPVEAVKKLLRPGEIERLARAADVLNGYGTGSVVPVTPQEAEAAATAVAVGELEKN